jgi:uncharacterized protein (TIGR03437 family)
MNGAILLAVFSSASVLSAQTAETTFFRALMQASNEVPAATGGDSGAADMVVHVVRDSSNNILSGSIDFNLTYQFPGDQSVTGLGIVNSPTGASPTFIIATPISSASPINAAAGSGRIESQVQISAGNQAGLAILNGMLASPAQYSVNLLTADSPNGAMSGGLQKGAMAIRMAAVTSSAGSGVATVSVFYTGPAYAVTSAEVSIQLSYQFPAQVTFSGMRIYSGQGESGRIAVSALVAPGTQSAAGGAGVLTTPSTEIDMSNLQMVQGVQNVLVGRSNFSVDVDTVENPNAPLTGQLRGTDSMTFQFANPHESNTAWAIRLYTLRTAAGQVQAATVIFDVNYREPAGAQFASLGIDSSIPAPAAVTDPTGSGNFFLVADVFDTNGLSTLNDLVMDPENHVISVSLKNPASSYAIQVAVPDTTSPIVAAVIPIVEVKTLSTFAPGELVEIYGTNLAKVTTDLSGWPGVSLPSQLNGVSVTIGGQTARILYVSPGQVDAALPFETPTGSQPLTLNNGNSPSAPISLNVAAIAPAIYDFAFENTNFSLVTSSHAAKAGDVLVFYTTGMGQTTPALATGQTVPVGPPFNNTTPVTVTIGGVSATVDYSIGAPPYVAGLYQMAVTVPAGLGQGNVPVIATTGGLASNAVMIAVQ